MKQFLFGVLGVVVALLLVGAGLLGGALYTRLSVQAEQGAAAFNFLQQQVKAQTPAVSAPASSPPK